MTRHPSARFCLMQGRVLRDAALVLQWVWAARIERAARRGAPCAGDLALQHNPIACGARIRWRHGRQQRSRVRVQRSFVEHRHRRYLQQLAQIHHRDAIGHVADHGKIVGDEEVGELASFAKVVEEIEHLGLDGNVQG